MCTLKYFELLILVNPTVYNSNRRFNKYMPIVDACGVYTLLRHAVGLVCCRSWGVFYLINVSTTTSTPIPTPLIVGGDTFFGQWMLSDS